MVYDIKIKLLVFSHSLIPTF